LRNIIEIATRLKEVYNTQNPFEIAENMGIIIWREHLGNLKGLYKYNKKNRYIILNNNLNEIEQKIVCAHELGHDILHRNITVAAFNEYTLVSDVGKREYEANLFACEILISDEQVIELIDNSWTVSQMACYLHTDMHLLLIKLKGMKEKGYDVNVPLDYDSCFLKS